MNRFKNASAVFSLVWKVSPSYFFLLILNSLAYSGQILANMVLMQLGGEYREMFVTQGKYYREGGEAQA